MQPRERILAALVAAMAVLGVCWLGWQQWYDAASSRSARIKALNEDIAKKRQSVARGEQARAKLAAWQKLSLPENQEAARFEYKQWLQGVIDKAKFSGAQLTSQSVVGRRSALSRINFTITGDSTLGDLTQFLYDFYKGGYLHQIRSLQIQPAERSGQLRLTIGVEAGVVQGAGKAGPRERKPSDRLAWPTLAKYRELIVGRNLFTEYVPPAPAVVARPPRPPDPPRPPAFDPARFAFLTAILQIGDRPQAWINVRTTGETKKLSEGDEFQIGTVKGKIVRIGERDVEILDAGKPRPLALGDPLRKAPELRTGGL